MDAVEPVARLSPHGGDPSRLLTIDDFVLRIASFKIHRYGQFFVNPHDLYIDLRRFRCGIYRVVAVQNFQIEDDNPTLKECLAGIFIAGQRDDEWEIPEDPPIECRSILVLGRVDAEKGRIL